MTSSNENISVLLTLCDGNPPALKTSDEELWCFLWYAPVQTVEQTIETPSDLRCHRVHYDVNVIGPGTRICFICHPELTISEDLDFAKGKWPNKCITNSCYKYEAPKDRAVAIKSPGLSGLHWSSVELTKLVVVGVVTVPDRDGQIPLSRFCKRITFRLS